MFFSNKVNRILMISKFKNKQMSNFSSFRVEALAAVPRRFHGKEAVTTLPSPNQIRRNSNENKLNPKLQKEKILSSVNKIERKPMIKNLFKGEFDVNLFAFPEVLNADEIANLECMIEQVRYFFLTQVDSAKIDENGKIPDHVLRGLKELGLFGLKVSEEYGGIQLKETSLARLMEICGTEPSIGLMLNFHQNAACHIIQEFGNSDQKTKYLPKLCSGEFIGAVCMAEVASGNDIGAIETFAESDLDQNGFVLNGNKIWVSNGGFADVFIVFGMVEETTYDGEKDKKLAIFIVDKNSDGMTFDKEEEKLGVRGLSTSSIQLKNVRVPKENLLADNNQSLRIANDTLCHSRLTEAMLISGLLKQLVNNVIHQCINREQFSKPLSENELVKEKVAQIGTNAYVVESMIYLTAALKDSTINPDLELEATATKIFASEVLWKCVNDCLEIFGSKSYLKSMPFEKILRDSKAFPFISGTNDVLRQYLTQLGLKTIGVEVGDEIEELRNPAFYPVKSLKKMIENLRIEQGKFSLKHDLSGYLHPTLKLPADNLEKSVIKLDYMVGLQLTRQGRSIMDKQIILRKLADIIVSIYAQTAALSRSSRSYCIGLHNAELEIMMASTFCYEQYEFINKTFDQLELTQFESPDDSNVKIGEVLFNEKKYCLTNPVKLNW